MWRPSLRGRRAALLPALPTGRTVELLKFGGTLYKIFSVTAFYPPLSLLRTRTYQLLCPRRVVQREKSVLRPTRIT